MRLWALILVCVWGLGCGSDDDDGGDGGDAVTVDGGQSTFDGSSVDPDGAALECAESSTSGTVGGVMVDPVNQAFTVAVDFARVIVLSEGTESCTTDGDAGQSLVLIFCDPNVPVGEYTVVTEQAFPDAACPGEKTALAIVEENLSGGDVEDSVSGTITIDGIGDCLSGSFDVTFTDDSTMTGQFSAISCD